MGLVYVGLSGGVDSAVAAYLLRKEGHDVAGAFIKGWEPDFLPCTGTADRLSAMRVAAHLEIPFVTVDLSKEYKKLVVDQFVAEYKAGRTPNPDVLCNRAIKFGAFWQYAKAHGADFIATGHYALLRQGYGGRAVLGVSKDSAKDQTYFLWTLTQEDLKHTLFPIGSYKKSEVRAIAKRAKLPNATRKDSQGLCFLGHVDMHEFLKRYIKPKRGTIIYDSDQRVIGEHDGAWFYTLGQHVPTSSPKRLYVVGKDVRKNVLTVSETPRGESTRYTLTTMSWISGSAPKFKFQAQYRYHGPLVGAEVKGHTVAFDEPVLVASGQSVVFFDPQNKVCLGGGTIE